MGASDDSYPPNLDTNDATPYEWLLSDHPDATRNAPSDALSIQRPARDCGKGPRLGRQGRCRRRSTANGASTGPVDGPTRRCLRDPLSVKLM